MGNKGTQIWRTYLRIAEKLLEVWRSKEGLVLINPTSILKGDVTVFSADNWSTTSGCLTLQST
jgi:hypothetical protein